MGAAPHSALSNPVDAGPLHRAIGAIRYCIGSLWPPTCRIFDAPTPPDAPKGAAFLRGPPVRRPSSGIAAGSATGLPRSLDRRGHRVPGTPSSGDIIPNSEKLSTLSPE